jgi:MFS family permease
VGTALPHLLKDFTGSFPWHLVVYITSGLAATGGLLMYILVPDGPFRKPGQKLDPSVLVKVFNDRDFRSAAFGYFGHMWELYAFWAFVPVMLTYFLKINPSVSFNVPLLSFLVIGLGGMACVAGGYISRNIGTRRTAFTALFLSCTCCILSPFVFHLNSTALLIGFFIFWGLVVIADSPLFSTLVAQNSVPENRGTALTIVNSIGFFITIISIQMINLISMTIDTGFLYLFLAFGPVLGLFALYNNRRRPVSLKKMHEGSFSAHSGN